MCFWRDLFPEGERFVRMQEDLRGGRPGTGGLDQESTSSRDAVLRRTPGPTPSRSVTEFFRSNGQRNDGSHLLGDETLVILVRKGLVAAAERKFMSPRTLRRRIREAGTTVSEIVRTTRRSLSLSLLRRGVRMSRISALLGYKSGRCFSRFVRREFGETPTELRRRVRSNEDAG